MSSLRARCPHCETLTAVALGPEYQCHACGREFRAGLVRVPCAWGAGGETMREAAWLPLPYPEASVVEEDVLGAQTLALAADLPARPLVLGGDCTAHVGAIEALTARHDRLAVVWIDAHGDLNTPATSPSGNEWGMALRMVLDSRAVAPEHVALVGARNLDPPERDFIAVAGIREGPDAVARATDGVGCVYVAVDADALDERDVASFMPEPGGLALAEAEELLSRLARSRNIVGAGFSGLAAEQRNVEPLTRLAGALGF